MINWKIFITRSCGVVVMFLFCFGSQRVKAQGNIRDSSLRIILTGVNYSFEKPQEHLAQRFGQNHSLGPLISYKSSSGWLFGIEYNFLFGSRVKIDPLQNLQADNGHLINGKGEFEPVNYHERGTLALFKAGKLFPILNPNPNSGFFFQLGTGFLQHKIKYQYHSNSLYQLKEAYLKGYDRLTNGWATSQSLGYLFLSNKRLVNFSIALEAIQAFTQNRRSWNFDTMEKDDRNRFDLLFGIKFSWIFPIYRKAPEEYYYY